MVTTTRMPFPSSRNKDSLWTFIVNYLFAIACSSRDAFSFLVEKISYCQLSTDFYRVSQGRAFALHSCRNFNIPPIKHKFREKSIQDRTCYFKIAFPCHVAQTKDVTNIFVYINKNPCHSDLGSYRILRPGPSCVRERRGLLDTHSVYFLPNHTRFCFKAHLELNCIYFS